MNKKRTQFIQEIYIRVHILYERGVAPALVARVVAVWGLVFRREGGVARALIARLFGGPVCRNAGWFEGKESNLRAHVSGGVGDWRQSTPSISPDK